MNWRITPRDYQVYQRNPLDAVVIQVRFQPILRVAKGSGVEEFQERLRRQFPQYQETKVQNLTVDLPERVEVTEENLFEFSRPKDSCKVTLAKENVALEAKNHQNRDTLIEDLGSAIDALSEVYDPVVITRIGVRYINIVDRVKIERELGRSVGWDTLVSSEYLRMPSNIADFAGTRFVTEISSRMDIGEMTLRYGLLPSKMHRRKFRFDMDRYCVGEVDVSEISNLVHQFTVDIFNLFHTFPGNDLLDWMSKKDEELHISEVDLDEQS